jgi:hypothetical protein
MYRARYNRKSNYLPEDKVVLCMDNPDECEEESKHEYARLQTEVLLDQILGLTSDKQA